MSIFDDSALEDHSRLAEADPILRRLAEGGARIRRETADAGEPITQLRGLPRPRAVIAAGSEARFIRAMLEPVCPVPFVAWPTHGLPGWVGALDLVVVMASDGAPAALVATVHEAVRRGAQLLIACPAVSTIAEHAGSRSTVLLPTSTADPLAAAIVVLSGLNEMQLGPKVLPDAVADALDQVAEDCSPFADVSENPAKDLALGLADAQPLVWGGSVLAARASRRIAEALRAASGRAALAADADEHCCPSWIGRAARSLRGSVHRRCDRPTAGRAGDAGRRQQRHADPLRPCPAGGGGGAQRRTRLPDCALDRLGRRALRHLAADRDVCRGLPLGRSGPSRMTPTEG